MPKPILGYWNYRGYGQHIKAVLFYLGVDYDLKTYMDNLDGGRDAWFKEKFSLGLDFPNVPYWIDNDVKLTEKMAILKYVCRTFGPDLLPLGHEAKGEMLEGFLTDVLTAIVNYVYRPTDEIRAGFAKNVKPKFQQLSKFLGTNDFLFGDDVSYLDFYMYEILYHYKTFEGVVPELGFSVAEYPGLDKYFQRFEALPKMQEFIKSPGYIAGPCYSCIAKVRC